MLNFRRKTPFVIGFGPFLLVCVLFLARTSESQRERSPKFFPFLVAVKYDYGSCRVNGREGTCIPHYQCKNKDGIELDVCAQGYGTCCLIEKSCFNSNPIDVKDNQTFLINPSTNQPGRSSICQFTFPKKTDVCQIRLDFIDTFIGSPRRTYGTCPGDSIIVSGSNTIEMGGLNTFTACGNLSNQHMYLGYGNSKKITLKIKLSEVNQTSRYRIKLTQLKCDAERKVPDYCFQHFTEETGDVRSFGHTGNPTTSVQLNNQIYNICIDPPGQNTGLKFNFLDFFVSGMNVSQTPGGNCADSNDFVQIFGHRKPLCGLGANISPTQEIQKPYFINVNFDSQEALEPMIFGTPPQGGMWNTTTCRPDLAGPMYNCDFISSVGCVCNVPTPSPGQPGYMAQDIENTGFRFVYSP